MQNINKTTAPNSVVVITGTITKETIEKERSHAITHIQQHITIDGFRKGSIPEALVIAHVGERAVQEAAAEHAVSHELHELLLNQGVMPITSPHISITLEAAGDASVEIRSIVYPHVELPDYKAIAADVHKGKQEVTVTEEEVTDALVHFKRERIRVEALESGEEPEAALEKAEKTVPEELPALDDAFVQTIGFDTTAAFEESIRKNLQTGKEDRARSEMRAKILKGIAATVVVEVPEPLVEYEIAKMEAGLAQYVMQAGMTLEQYYEKIGKTRDALFTEWKDEATDRAKQQLILIEIGRKEKINEDEKELNALVEDIKKRDENVDETAVRSHYQVLLRNEKVLQFLEQA